MPSQASLGPTSILKSPHAIPGLCHAHVMHVKAQASKSEERCTLVDDHQHRVLFSTHAKLMGFMTCIETVAPETEGLGVAACLGGADH